MSSENKKKVQALYQAVAELLAEHADLNRLKVEDITRRAGIGKGTAYEYFDSKEDIIVSAVLYLSQKIFQDLQKEVQKHNGFKEQLYVLFSILESGIIKNKCLFRILHMMLGVDNLSSQFKERMKKGKDSGPFKIVYYLAEQGQKEGVLRKEYPVSYLVAVLSTKILLYLMFLNNQDLVQDCGSQQFKKLIYEGIIRELGTYK